MENTAENAHIADKAKLQRSEQAYRTALQDVHTFTSKQTQACKADFARLSDRIAAVLKRPVGTENSPSEASEAALLQSLIGEGSNLTATFQNQVPKLRRGTYPAIDRLLARKQAINKLHCLRPALSSSETSRCKDASTSCPLRQICTTSNPSEQQPDGNAESARLTPAPLERAASYLLQSCTSANADSNGRLDKVPGSKPTSSRNASAQSQYTHFKAWRQQRHDAAVIVQRCTRRFLAKQLTAQLRRLNVHVQRRQQHMLAACLLAWREYASSVVRFRMRIRQRDLRYGLWQHCYLGRQFDGDSIFHSDGNAVMATKYRQWRTKAVVLTRWQFHSTCLFTQEEQSGLITAK